MSVIHANHLTKVFPIRERGNGLKGTLKALLSGRNSMFSAVTDISFEVAKGEVVGFLGPNGAGKSTTLKMLTGILHPTSGTVLLNGISPHTDRISAVKQIGVTFGNRSQLLWDLRLEDSFELLRRIYQIPASTYKQNLSWLGDAVGFRSYLATPVRNLSLGQRMRAEIAAALIHSPEVLFVDEPTIGLDIEAKDAVRKLMSQINGERNTTIMLTTHDVEDVKAVCNRLIIINEGRLIQDGSIRQLIKAQLPNSFLEIEFSHEIPELIHPHVAIVRKVDRRLLLKFDGNAITAGALISEICSKYQIQNLSIKEPGIESIIRQYFAKDKMPLEEYE